MKKLTTKQRTLLEAARDRKAFAGKAGFRSKRSFVITVNHEAGNFNTQFDRLEALGLVELGSRTDGIWGPRYVNITAAGQQALTK